MLKKKKTDPATLPEISNSDTLPKLLVRNAQKFTHSKVALREKEFGLWQSFTWQDYIDHVRYFCLGLVCLGLEKNDKIAIVGDNRPEWVLNGYLLNWRLRVPGRSPWGSTRTPLPKRWVTSSTTPTPSSS
jgi:hypothetical protein